VPPIYTGGGGVYGQAPVVPAGNALVFPSNGASPVGEFVVFQFTGANLPTIQPLTLIWRVKPQQQDGYYTTFFHGQNDGSFSGTDYFGCHPYPPSGGSAGTVHNWEIAVEEQDDSVDENANSTVVTKNQWYTQAVVTRTDGGAQSIIDYYWNLTVGVTRIINRTTTGGALENAPASPALTFGDAPWSHGQERLSGSLGQVKIFSTNLSEADIASEAANMNAIVTAAGIANRWWFKPGFSSVDDLTDAVTSKVAAWNNANKATLGEQL
jgi:hypothetical protein